MPESSGINIYQAENQEYPSETFLIDKDIGRVTKVEGGIRAVKQMMEITLNTERYAWQIYSSDFGHELKKLVGRPPEYVKSMVKRRIREAFSMDSRILSVDDFQFEITAKGTMHCTFTAHTVYGKTDSEVEL